MVNIPSHRYLNLKYGKCIHDRLQYYMRNIYYLLLCTIVRTVCKFEFVEFAPAGLSV